MPNPRTLTQDHCECFTRELRVTQGTATQKLRGIRNASLAILMLETGLRVGELCKLRIDDLWYADQPVSTLVVRKEVAKTKQERHIPVSERLALALTEMYTLIWLDSLNPTKRFAFSAERDDIPLSTRTVQRIIESAGRDSLHQHVTPHKLRHTFASRMMRKTNARVVQALLGHTNLQSTQIYMHPDAEDLRKAIDS